MPQRDPTPHDERLSAETLKQAARIAGEIMAIERDGAGVMTLTTGVVACVLCGFTTADERADMGQMIGQRAGVLAELLMRINPEPEGRT